MGSVSIHEYKNAKQNTWVWRVELKARMEQNNPLKIVGLIPIG